VSETIEKITRPAITGGTVLSHPAHKARTVRLATNNGQKHPQQDAARYHGASARAYDCRGEAIQAGRLSEIAATRLQR
jgi:hypothetical protein